MKAQSDKVTVLYRTYIAPPLPPAKLLVKAQSVAVTVPDQQHAVPPLSPAELLVKVQPVRVAEPRYTSVAPPLPPAELLVKAQFVAVNDDVLPVTRTAPAPKEDAVLLVSAQSVTVNVPPDSTNTAPPVSASPSRSVSDVSVRSPPFTWNKRVPPPPLIVAPVELVIATVPLIVIRVVNVTSFETSMFAPSVLADDKSEKLVTVVVAATRPAFRNRAAATIPVTIVRRGRALPLAIDENAWCSGRLVLSMRFVPLYRIAPRAVPLAPHPPLRLVAPRDTHMPPTYPAQSGGPPAPPSSVPVQQGRNSTDGSGGPLRKLLKNAKLAILLPVTALVPAGARLCQSRRRESRKRVRAAYLCRQVASVCQSIHQWWNDYLATIVVQAEDTQLLRRFFYDTLKTSYLSL